MLKRRTTTTVRRVEAVAPPAAAEPVAAPVAATAEGRRPVALTLTIVEGNGARRGVPVAGRIVVGRDPAGDLVIQDPEVSARHACFAPADGGIAVEDLGSSNGTFVNGTRLDGACQLQPGDRVQLGATVIEVAQGSGGAPATPSRKRFGRS